MRTNTSDLDTALREAVYRHDYDAATSTLSALLNACPTDAFRWHQLGFCLSQLGNLRGAEEAIRKACHIDAALPAQWIDLGAVRAKLSDLEGAAQALELALKLEPGNPIAEGNLAGVLVRQGKLQEGTDRLRRAWEAAPHLVWLAEALALALDEAGQPEAAFSVLEQANKSGGQCTLRLGQQALKLGRSLQAQALARQLSLMQPWHAGAQDLALQAARALGTPYDDPLDVSELVHVSQPEELQGPFCEALAAHVCAHPSLLASPHGHATVKGWHTGSLRVTPRGPVAALERGLEQALGQYAQTAPPTRVWTPPGAMKVMFNMWGVVFRGHGGHQEPHIHPDAWLSGVFYAQLPTEMQTASARDQQLGWLRFTEGPQTAQPLHAHEPMVGQLLVFPAYLYHHTVPCPFASPRVSVAFDVVPLA